MRFLLVLTALLALFAPMIYGADWVVIVVGSSTFDNYRHQADGCHAYQVVHKFGVPDSNIITMMYDDVASDPSNPFPGKLFNKPANTLAEAVDVYHKCKIDYRGEDVNAANFLSVLTGNSTGVPKGKPVLKSTSSDRVFINFVDHGGSGIIAMPTGPYVYAADLINALKTMHSKKMYSKAALYFEACEGGSMFENILPSNLNIYATTAANADESSYGDYCAPSDTVNGVEIGSCLGDLYSTNWLENSDAAGESETLLKQITTVIAETTESHVMQYGTLSFTNLPIGDFQGNLQGRRSHHSSHKQSLELKGRSSTLVNSRDISLHNKYYRYIRSVKSSTPNELSARALTELNNELNARKYADTLFDKLAAKLSYTINGSSDGSSFFALPKKSVTEGTECQKNVDNAFDKLCGGFTDYSLKYHRVVVNACHQTNDDTIINILKDVCASLQSNMIQL